MTLVGVGRPLPRGRAPAVSVRDAIPERSSKAGTVRRGAGVAVLTVALYVVGACILFRQQIFSGFDLYFGDRGDARLILFVHEHVYRALRGEASFLSPPEFYNLKYTLGGSDAFVLNQLVYAPLRLLGADPYLALVLGILLLSLLAYGAMCGFLTQRLNVPLVFSAPAAFVAVFPNYLFEKSGHIQNFAIYFAPLLMWWGIYALSEIHCRSRRACAAAAAAGLLYGLLLATGYYVAWFLGIGLAAFLAVFALSDLTATSRWCRRNPRAIAGLLLSSVAGLACGVGLFLAIYVPVLQWTVGWSFAHYMDGAFTFAQALSVGPDNLLWGALARWIGRWPFVGSHRIAVTPFVTLCILASLALAAHRRPWIWMDSELSRRVVLAAGLTCILLVLFTVRVGGLSVFAVLQVAVPGARAIRLAERVLVVVNFFGVLAIAVTLARLTAKCSGEGDRQRDWRAVLAGFLWALLMFEQVNSGRNAWVSRAAEAVHFSAVRTPPPECRAFFVTPQRALSASQNQTDAMMVVHRVGLPTLNGTTGINPPGHPLADVFAPDYQQRAVAWATAQDTLDWLCRLDIPTGEWLHWTKLEGGPRLGPGETIALTRSGDWSRILIKGWSRPEEGSVWSDSPEAKLLLPIAQSGDRETTLEFNAHAFVAQRHPEVTVTVAAGGETLAVWRFTREAWTQTLLLEVPRRLVSPIGLLLSFQIATPESPRRLGLHDDGRLLGLGLRSIRVIR